ncbi:response regulator [Rhodothermus marinus]|uniref:response regulator n=1 Tax=Rhodothermus marinus TaxID=29549 RepID=UPI0006D11127|nr:response regulator [Rhodothermus marinus]
MKLLLIEPSQLRCRISNLLRLGGIEDVTEATSSTEALRLLQKQVFDLLLIGPTVKDPSGLELLRRVRQMEGHEDTAALIFLDMPTDELVLEAAELDVQGIIVVPFEDDYLLYRVRETLRKLRQRRQQAEKPAYRKRLHLITSSSPGKSSTT